MAPPGSALLSLRRTVTDAGGVVAVLTTVLLVCTLVTGVVAAVSSWQRDALRASLQALPPDATAVEVRGTYEPADAGDLDQAVRRTLQPVLDVVGGRLLRRVETVDHRQPGGRPWAFASLTSDSPAVVADSGRLPSGTTAPGVVTVAAPSGSGLEAGDRLTLVDPLDGDRVPVRVSGTWAPDPAVEPLVPATDRDALLVPESVLPRLAGRAATVTWRAAPELERLTPDDLDEVASAAAPVEQSLAELGETLSTTLRVETPLTATLAAAAEDLTAQRTLLLRPVAILLLLGAAVALLVAAALAANRADDEGLLRSRGADRRRLTGPAALEAAVVCVLGGAVGVLLAATGLRVLGVPVEVGVPALTAAAVAAAVCWVALTAPALSRAVGGDRAEVAAVERRRRRTATLLIAVVVLVLALGAVALLGLRRSTSDRPPGAGIDLLAVAAPALLLLATTTVLALVLLPAGFRLATAGSRTRGLALALGTRSVARSATRALPLALVLALVGGGLVHAAIERASRAATVEAATADAVGADVRVLVPPSSIRAGAEEELSWLAALPGVQDVTPVRRTTTFIDDVPVDLLVADLRSPAASALLPPGSEGLLAELTSAPGTAVPIAITDRLAESASLDTGAVLELFVDEPRVLEIAGTVPDVPTVAEGRTAVLLDAGTLGAAPAAPSEWWLSVDDGTADDVARALAERPDIAEEVLTGSAVRQRLTVDPSTGGTAYDAALLATAAGAGLLGVVLIASLVLLRRGERAATTTFLRALGASQRDVTLTVVLEQAVVTGGGLVVGALAGGATALVARTVGDGGELALPWSTVLPALALLLVVPWVAVLVTDRRGARQTGRWSR